MRIFKKLNLFIYLSIFIISCNSDSTNSVVDKMNDVNAQDTSNVSVSNELFDQMIGSIPSPIELSTIIKESGAAYNSQLLSSTGKVDLFADDKYKAINLGAYSLDLGYMNLYNKSLSTLDYLSAINKVAGDLNLGSFFNLSMLQKLSSSENSEELMKESTASFRRMNSFLIEQKRGEISVLIILGSWIEGIYLTSEIARKTNDKNLKDRVAEQKIAVDNMIILLTIFKENPDFTDLISEVQTLKKLYDGVTINHVYKAPTQKIVNGEIEIIDNSTDEITYEPSTLDNISKQILMLRNKLTKTTK